jgi:hypothetical protein
MRLPSIIKKNPLSEFAVDVFRIFNAFADISSKLGSDFSSRSMSYDMCYKVKEGERVRRL